MPTLGSVIAAVFLVACSLHGNGVETIARPPTRFRYVVNMGVVLPYSTFRLRNYRSAVVTTIAALNKTRPPLLFSRKGIRLSHTLVMMSRQPSPTEILNILCTQFIENNVSVIVYLTNYETYGRETASSQYFLHLAGYLGLPVVAWNADNSGLTRSSASELLSSVQLAPSLAQQTAALLSILVRYGWQHVAIVTSLVAGGRQDFPQAVHEQAQHLQHTTRFRLYVEHISVVDASPGQSLVDLQPLAVSQARIILLYSTREEARQIFAEAKKLQLTGTNYLWLCLQSVIGSTLEAPREFPIGILGVHFNTDEDHLMHEMGRAVRVVAHGLDQVIRHDSFRSRNVSPAPERPRVALKKIACSKNVTRLADLTFYKYLKNVSITEDSGKPKLEFYPDGHIKHVQLQILNLRHEDSRHKNEPLVWQQIGVWKSWKKEALDIKDIVWPGGKHNVPQGVPEKFHMKITFLEEPPYVNLAPLDPISGKCGQDKGVLCRVTEMNGTGTNNISAKSRCCSGFCIDLLEKFASDLGFTYDLFRVQDGKWGAYVNGRWNGLVSALINHRADMVMTSLKVNFERSQVIDFSVPFLDTGIAIVVAKRTGIISPTAFLEPFDTAMWMLVALVTVHVAAFAIFFFEWLSPIGYDSKFGTPRDHRFSLCRTLWLVWAILFQAAVNVDCPKGYTARCMANVWAMFALIFLAIYTANLAAFMITREEFHDLTGINDTKLSNPFTQKPPFRFGTIPHGNTDAVLRRNFPEMHTYMRAHARTTVIQGVEAVKHGKLDAFVYDATVLDYLVGQDPECVLLTVGSWFAMTGYSVGFPKNSRYIALINNQLMKYKENGFLEQLQRFWFTGACNKYQTMSGVNEDRNGKHSQSRSDPLALEQFISTFLLLGAGIILSFILLALEKLYAKYALKKIVNLTEQNGMSNGCSMISMSIGASLLPTKTKTEKVKHVKQKPTVSSCSIVRKHLEAILATTNQQVARMEERLREHHNFTTVNDLSPAVAWDLNSNSSPCCSCALRSQKNSPMRKLCVKRGNSPHNDSNKKSKLMSEFETTV